MEPRTVLAEAAIAWRWAAAARRGPGVGVAVQGALRGAHAGAAALGCVLSLGGRGQPAWLGARCLEGSVWSTGAACPGAPRAARRGHAARASVRSTSGLIRVDFVGCSSLAASPRLRCGVLPLGVPSVGHVPLAKAVVAGTGWMWEASLPGRSSLSGFLPVSIGAASLWKRVQLPGVGFPAPVPGRAARCWVRLPRGRRHESEALRGLAVTLRLERGEGRQFFIRRSAVCVCVRSRPRGRLAWQFSRSAMEGRLVCAGAAPAARWACFSRPWH